MDKTPHTKTSVFQALEESFQLVAESCKSLPQEALHCSIEGKWSIAEQVDHLIKSGQPVLKGMHLPKEQLLAIFGRMDRSPYSFLELKAFYLKTLKENAIKAPPKFQPNIENGIKSTDLLAKWEALSAQFQVVAEVWTEEDLDQYAMAHPILGLLSVKEMLFFTIFHNAHHLLQIETIKETFLPQT
ncbi:MAG: DinB family protein [Saprospiraceae bacterium]